MSSRVFKYKLDFYYQQTLLYLFTFVLYAGIRGSFVEGQFSFAFQDPLVYIITLFFVMALGTLFLNLWRDRKLIVEDSRLVFHTRYREREIRIEDIEWIHIGRDLAVQTAGRFQQVLIKTRERRRAYRIRVGRYERVRELVMEMEKIAERVPKHEAIRMPGKRFR
ncbi:MAG: hypothetical protein A2X67_04105 [Ignavibacteria bacterium GWA2_55_11]|nr:MAG: hypothetical protein A2X67_04105 [Ignavibacteria bacterium GWA2_55_11]OGU47060.1 MAG: hypothetical protein A2X68_00400 [Ignavibacteria bacterium GWC2_56_12]OGU68495.1 MAG: hypothetical protein A3C56_02145 [Ignavibacteria bacterium RIFCSPHIGHO2_02_FULL_56_12]OGU72579.1 MAG: hypothetical protein A3H45_09315 [Ignavibacteria bacterium RIFCSPLOWO2_02_FULL_55_14]OGU74736.1 MAG: hypothetical protein A3G43_12490 [Ignavibacteria bacterium RIFCSPLOWO2_12_FULL_56_21]HAV22997.1 hypothetical protei